MKSLIKKNQLMITALAIMIAIAGYLQFAGTNLEEEYLTTGDGKDASAVDSGGVITDNYTASDLQQDLSTEGDLVGLDGLLDLSEEDLLAGELEDIQSLDTDVDVIMEDYLDEDMQIQDVPQNQLASVTPEEGEIPGEAVFTNATGMEILSDAKLLKEQTRAKNKETLLDIINSAELNDEQKQDAVSSMVRMTEVAEKEAAAEILLEAKGFSDVVVSLNGNSADVVVNALELTEAQRAQIEDIVNRKTGVAPENIIISTVVQ
ncbi:MAG: SpoIIIAH-like family protein [Roseburia sp.]|nr:SpoIIIAH-like family protein [Roseburia sp.]